MHTTLTYLLLSFTEVSQISGCSRYPAYDPEYDPIGSSIVDDTDTFWDRDHFAFGEAAVFECNRSRGSAKRILVSVCQHDGQWSKIEAKCNDPEVHVSEHEATTVPPPLEEQEAETTTVLPLTSTETVLKVILTQERSCVHAKSPSYPAPYPINAESSVWFRSDCRETEVIFEPEFDLGNDDTSSVSPGDHVTLYIGDRDGGFKEWYRSVQF